MLSGRFNDLLLVSMGPPYGMRVGLMLLRGAAWLC